MKNKKLFERRLRKESSKQNSGYINTKSIKIVKNKNYYVKDIHLDGDAPKEYIHMYSYYNQCPRKNTPRKWNGYFAKYGGKSYPHESVNEFVINKIGEYLGMNMNETELVIINEQIRFLSKDFLTKNKKLIHGIEIIGEYFEDQEFINEIDQNRKERRKYLIFEIIENSIEHVCKGNAKRIMIELIKMIVFDAIVGNNDRHFYNWGLIGDVMKMGDKPPIFAPIYDSARALLWNKTDKDIERMYSQFINGSDELDKFILKTKPRISYSDDYNCNHFDLIKFLFSYKNEYKDIIKKYITKKKQEIVINCLREKDFVFFTKKRSELIEAILNKRFNKLREITC